MGTKRLYEQYTKDELQELIKNATSKKDFLSKIGYKTNTHNYKKTFDNIVEKYDLKDFSFKSTYSTDLTGQIFGYLQVLKEDPTNQKYQKHKWICKCLLCGEEVSVRRNGLVSKNTFSCGCKCFSRGEKLINDYLKENNINFERQKTFSDLKGNDKLLKFDFYLPDFNILIEFQGQQHFYSIELFGGDEQFKLQLQYDELKRNWCKKNDYTLIEINYTEIRKIDQILNKILKGDV